MFNDDPIAERLLQRGAGHKMGVDEAAEIFQRSSCQPLPTYIGRSGTIAARVEACLASSAASSSKAAVANTPASSSSSRDASSNASGGGADFLSALLDDQDTLLSRRANIGEDRRLVADPKKKGILQDDDDSVFVCMKRPLLSKRLEIEETERKKKEKEQKKKQAEDEKVEEKRKMEEEAKERRRRDEEAEAASRKMRKNRQGDGSGSRSGYSSSYGGYSSSKYSSSYSSSSHHSSYRSRHYNRDNRSRSPSRRNGQNSDIDRTGLSSSSSKSSSDRQRGSSSRYLDEDRGRRGRDSGKQLDSLDRHARYRSGGRDSSSARRSQSRERDGSSSKRREQSLWSNSYFATASSSKSHAVNSLTKTDASEEGATAVGSAESKKNESLTVMTLPKLLFNHQKKSFEKSSSSGLEQGADAMLAGRFKKPESDLATVVNEGDVDEASKCLKDGSEVVATQPTTEEGKSNRLMSLFGDDSDASVTTQDLVFTSPIPSSERRKTSDKSLIKSSRNDGGNLKNTRREGSENSDKLSYSDLGKCSYSTTSSKDDDVSKSFNDSKSSIEQNVSNSEDKSLEDPKVLKKSKGGFVSTFNLVVEETTVVDVSSSSCIENSREEIVNLSEDEEHTPNKRAIDSHKVPAPGILREKDEHGQKPKSDEALPTGVEENWKTKNNWTKTKDASSTSEKDRHPDTSKSKEMSTENNSRHSRSTDHSKDIGKSENSFDKRIGKEKNSTDHSKSDHHSKSSTSKGKNSSNHCKSTDHSKDLLKSKLNNHHSHSSDDLSISISDNSSENINKSQNSVHNSHSGSSKHMSKRKASNHHSQSSDRTKNGAIADAIGGIAGTAQILPSPVLPPLRQRLLLDLFGEQDDITDRSSSNTPCNNTPRNTTAKITNEHAPSATISAADVSLSSSGSSSLDILCTSLRSGGINDTITESILSEASSPTRLYGFSTKDEGGNYENLESRIHRRSIFESSSSGRRSPCAATSTPKIRRAPVNSSSSCDADDSVEALPIFRTVKVQPATVVAPPLPESVGTVCSKTRKPCSVKSSSGEDVSSNSVEILSESDDSDVLLCKPSDSVSKFDVKVDFESKPPDNSRKSKFTEKTSSNSSKRNVSLSSKHLDTAKDRLSKPSIVGSSQHRDVTTSGRTSDLRAPKQCSPSPKISPHHISLSDPLNLSDACAREATALVMTSPAASKVLVESVLHLANQDAAKKLSEKEKEPQLTSLKPDDKMLKEKDSETNVGRKYEEDIVKKNISTGWDDKAEKTDIKLSSSPPETTTIVTEDTLQKKGALPLPLPPNSSQKVLADSRIVTMDKVSVVALIKSHLDPYYKVKEVSKDTYKVIVAKCVAKVMGSDTAATAEVAKCKIGPLVKGYVAVYQHRAKKMMMVVKAPTKLSGT